MTFYPVTQPVIHRPYPQIGFVHAKSPLDEPKIMVICNYFGIREFCVCHIPFQSVPHAVFLKSLCVYADCGFALYPQIFVVAPVVYMLFLDFSGSNLLLQAFKL